MYSNFSMIRISNDIIDIIDAPYYSNHFGAKQGKKHTQQEIRTNFPILNEKKSELMQFRWNKRKIHFDLMNEEGKCAYWKRKQLSINYESTHLTVSWLVNYFNISYRSCIDLLSTFEIKCLTIAHLLCRPCQNSPSRVLLNSSLVLCYK